MKLLLVEDNTALISSLKKHLGKQFIVDTANSGIDGLRRVFDGGHDVIVLDLHLPDKNGYEVCQAIRAAGFSVPILILTGASDAHSKVTLLDAGADDYVTKPFSMEELRSRLNALLRRSTGGAVNLLRVGDLVVDPGRRQVMRAGLPLDLRRKEFDILEYLVRHRGKTVTRNMILEHVWDANRRVSWHNTVDVHIKHLRDKVDRPFPTALIKTAYGIGYLIDDA